MPQHFPQRRAIADDLLEPEVGLDFLREIAVLVHQALPGVGQLLVLQGVAQSDRDLPGDLGEKRDVGVGEVVGAAVGEVQHRELLAARDHRNEALRAEALAEDDPPDVGVLPLHLGAATVRLALAERVARARAEHFQHRAFAQIALRAGEIEAADDEVAAFLVGHREIHGIALHRAPHAGRDQLHQRPELQVGDDRVVEVEQELEAIRAFLERRLDHPPGGDVALLLQALVRLVG